MSTLEASSGFKELRRVAERTLATLDSIGDAVLSTDLAGTITYLNAAAEQLTRWPASEAVGRPLHEVVQIVDAFSRQAVRDPLAMAMRRDAIVGLGTDCVLVRRDGSESAIEDTAAPIHDRHGTVTGAVIVFRDVGAAREMSLRMSHLAQHDVLTGLPNRLLLTDRLDRAIASSRRHGSSLAVMFMDLDGFKHINDTWGHAAGDEILQSVARRLLASVRDSDTVSRHGGDEFVVLLSEVTCAADIEASAELQLAAIAIPHSVAGQYLCVTACVGTSRYPVDGENPAALMKAADLALLRAKARRRVQPSGARAAAR